MIGPALRVEWAICKALYGTARDMEDASPGLRASMLQDCGAPFGVTYEGETRDGLAHGQGVMAVTEFCELSIHHEGQFRAGKPDGHGVRTYYWDGGEQQDRQEGEW